MGAATGFIRLDANGSATQARQQRPRSWSMLADELSQEVCIAACAGAIIGPLSWLAIGIRVQSIIDDAATPRPAVVASSSNMSRMCNGRFIGAIRMGVGGF